MLQDCAPTLAPFARVILVGEHNPHVYGQNSIFSSGQLSVSVFDLRDLCQRKPKTAARYFFNVAYGPSIRSNERLDCFKNASSTTEMG